MRNKRLFHLSECYAVDVQYLLRCSTLSSSPAYIYVVLYTGWSTFPRPHCSSADMFYYIQNDQHSLGLIACQLILCFITYRVINISSASLLVKLILCFIIYRIINISSASLLVSWYYVLLYTGWSTFPQPHCSSVDNMLYYIQDDQHFLGLIARQLILCCIIYRMINISSASLLVSWYYVVLYTGWSTFPRPHCSSVDIMLYYIQDDQHFLGLIACQFIWCCIIYRMINISSASLLVSWYYVVLYTGWSTFLRSHRSYLTGKQDESQSLIRK